MFTFLLIVQTLVAAALVTVILMQRSEGGGLGVGGSTSGLMSARGAADFLTRATAVLATLFVVLSIALAGLATVQRTPGTIDPSLARTGPAAPASPLGGQPPLGGGVALANDDPLAGAAAAVPGTTPPAAVPPTGNLEAPTPPENRRPTPERNRSAAPTPRTSPRPGDIRPSPLQPPAEVNPGPGPQTDTPGTAPAPAPNPAAPKQ